MQAEIIDPTAEPVPADWEIFRKHEGLPAAWQADALTALAWCARRPVYLGVVRDGGQVAGLFVGDVAGVRSRRGEYAEPGSTPLAGWFECRLLCGFTSGFALAAPLRPDGQAAVMAAFEKALRRRLGQRCLGILYRQVTNEMLPMVRRRFRPRIPTAPNTLLLNCWSDMQEYYADLPRDRRRRLRRTHAEAAEHTRPFGTDEIDPVQASLLAQLTRRKHGDLVPPIPPRYFGALNGTDGVRYIGHRDGQRLLAFDLVFDDGDRLVTTVTGSLEAGDGGRRGLYFDLYLQEIEYMISNGRSGCEFGKGMVELKQRFGCVLVPQSAVIAAW